MGLRSPFLLVARVSGAVWGGSAGALAWPRRYGRDLAPAGIASSVRLGPGRQQPRKPCAPSVRSEVHVSCGSTAQARKRANLRRLSEPPQPSRVKMVHQEMVHQEMLHQERVHQEMVHQGQARPTQHA